MCFMYIIKILKSYLNFKMHNNSNNIKTNDSQLLLQNESSGEKLARVGTG